MRKIILAAIILLTSTIGLFAQTGTTTSGGEALGGGGTVSYTVGQVAYQTYTGTNGSVAEGVQQPYEISSVTGIEEAKGISLSVSAYPNPTTDYLQLKVESEKLQNLSCQLFDMQGKLLQNKKLTGTETQIDMGNYVSATYFVKVTQNNKEVKTFKIIKN